MNAASFKLGVNINTSRGDYSRVTPRIFTKVCRRKHWKTQEALEPSLHKSFIGSANRNFQPSASCLTTASANTSPLRIITKRGQDAPEGHILTPGRVYSTQSITRGGNKGHYSQTFRNFNNYRGYVIIFSRDSVTRLS